MEATKNKDIRNLIKYEKRENEVKIIKVASENSLRPDFLKLNSKVS